MVRDVQSGRLDLGRDAEQVELLQDHEERRHDSHGPREDGEDDHDLAGQQVSVSSHDESVVVARADQVLGGKGSGGDESPHTGTGVDGDGIERVIDLEHVEDELGASDVDEGTDDSNRDGGPDLHVAARSGDGHESGEGAVSDHDEVDDGGSTLHLGQSHDDEQGGQGSGGGTEGGVNGHAGGESRVSGDSEGGTGVESEPSEPQEEHSEEGQRGVVSRHVDGLSVGIEASDTRSQDPGGGERGDSSDHVDGTVAGKVTDTDSEELVDRPEVRSPSRV